MAAVPMKPEYGPTLGRLLAPRWKAASRPRRVLTIAAGVVLAAVLIAAALSLLNSTYSHGGRVPFGFSYRGLYRAPPDRGGYVKVQSRFSDGALKYSFAVNRLRLPPYSGESSAELPIYATGLIKELAGSSPGFVLRGEGKTRVNSGLVGYEVLYYTRVQGRPMYARDVLLVPPHSGARDGVSIVMLTAPKASTQVISPLEVGTTGVLLRPLKTFSFG
jgi:hypothetical protein